MFSSLWSLGGIIGATQAYHKLLSAPTPEEIRVMPTQKPLIPYLRNETGQIHRQALWKGVFCREVNTNTRITNYMATSSGDHVVHVSSLTVMSCVIIHLQEITLININTAIHSLKKL